MSNKTYTVKMSKVSRPEGIEGGLRTDEVIGFTSKLPEVGKVFHMFSEPLDKSMDIRAINTSPVKNISSSFNEKHNTVYTLKTETGSVYTIEVINGNETN